MLYHKISKMITVLRKRFVVGGSGEFGGEDDDKENDSDGRGWMSNTLQ